jgi:hypothetical protein
MQQWLVNWNPFSAVLCGTFVDHGCNIVPEMQKTLFEFVNCVG